MAITLQEIRSKYPQYHDKSDIEMADAIHKKYYSDIPKEKVYERLGIDITGRQGGEITEEAEVGDDDSNTTGVLGVVSDLASGLGNAYKRGVNFVGNTPDMVEELGESLLQKPFTEPARKLGVIGSEIAGIGKSVINAPYDLNQYLAKKNLLGGKTISKVLGTLGKAIPHIPEDTGIEKSLGLDERKGDKFLRGLTEAAALVSGAAPAARGIKNKLTASSKERAFQRALEGNIQKAAESKGLAKGELNELKDSLIDEYTKLHPSKPGELTPIGQKSEINIKQQKLEANPEKSSEVRQVPEKPDTKTMLEDHKNLIEKAKADAEATVGIKTNPSKQAGKAFQSSIEDLEKSSGDIYNAARDYYKDKKIMADNTAEIKEATAELEKLSANEEFFEGKGSERTELMKTIKSLESEQVKASDVYSAMRTSQQLANKARMKRKGTTESEWNRLTKLGDKLDRHADKLAKRLEEVGGQDVRAMIKEANQGYRTFKELTVGKFDKGVFKTNPVAKEAFKTGNVPNHAMLKLADDLPGNQFLNKLVEGDSQLRKNLLAAYSGESNINKLTNPNSLTKKYLESLPEVEDKLNLLQKAISDYRGKEKEAVKINQAHDKLVQSMKDAAEAKRLEQQIQFHKDAIPKIEAKMKKVEDTTAEHAKLEKELKMHQQNLADKNHLLKKYGKYVAGYVVGNEIAKKVGF